MLESAARTVEAALVERLFDDAALFPPERAPMRTALPAHAAHRRSWYADLVGPFLCPASRVAELRQQWAQMADGVALQVALIADGSTGDLLLAAEAVAGDHRLALAGAETALRGDDLEAAARRTATAFGSLDDDLAFAVEVTPVGRWERALDVLADVGMPAKLRTGGTTAEAFPSEAAVAAFVVACVDRDLPFKCTAGLHDPQRHTDPATGFEHHGFLAVLLATHAARDGASSADLLELLAQDDADALAVAVSGLTAQQCRRTRDSLRSIGTCSVREPVDALVRLGLVLEGGPAA